ncbi:hypothetical protein [Campylobacter sp.]|uniref:hypothetical protein n=1 Tax=Campylobacter sp. TaxID=205 RepID=UPI002A7ED733|nr:hypothetical protein [Campylobacter sp.]MDY4444833.1 hypothetical protein [Campylobacter sp.]
MKISKFLTFAKLIFVVLPLIFLLGFYFSFLFYCVFSAEYGLVIFLGFVIFVLGYGIRAKIIITDENAIKKWEEIAKKRGSFEYLLNGFIANSNLWFVKGSGVKTFSIIGVIIMFLGLILLIVNK